MTAMAMNYDPKVGYKNNLIFNFMQFNENFTNWREEVKKKKKKKKKKTGKPTK